MMWKDRKEGLKELAKEKEEWTKIRELKEEFEEITNMRVTSQRVHQVIKSLEPPQGDELETKTEKEGETRSSFSKGLKVRRVKPLLGWR